jgi:hypothetical protein
VVASEPGPGHGSALQVLDGADAVGPEELETAGGIPPRVRSGSPASIEATGDPAIAV